jgi:hypothetical protein
VFQTEFEGGDGFLFLFLHEGGYLSIYFKWDNCTRKSYAWLLTQIYIFIWMGWKRAD